jgi:hypothetical protein
LEDLLKALEKADPERKTWLHIEFKDGDLDAIREAYRLIAELKRCDRVIWGHMEDEMALIIKKEFP